jgi:CheY-like chemotaxis protein
MSRIVVAEDDPHILRVISLWLTKQGHTVQEARNGKDALDLIEAQTPDILITDINMPVMGGLELMNRVVARTHLPRGIVVLTNRWDHREIGQQLADAGVHMMPKPFSPTKLAELIEEIDGSHATGGSRRP